MAEEEATPQEEDTGEAFGSAEEVLPVADNAPGEESVKASEPQGNEAFSDDANKERGLSQEQAQSELETLLKWKTREEDSARTQMTEQAGIWTQASKAAGLMTSDSRSMAAVGLKALDHDGSTGNVLRERGLDRNPAILAAFKAYGTSISNDQRIPGANSVGGGVTKSAAEILYPNQK